jgi:isoleucyl-tRNA synthetase
VNNGETVMMRCGASFAVCEKLENIYAHIERENESENVMYASLPKEKGPWTQRFDHGNEQKDIQTKTRRVLSLHIIHQREKYSSFANDVKCKATVCRNALCDFPHFQYVFIFNK